MPTSQRIDFFPFRTALLAVFVSVQVVACTRAPGDRVNRAHALARNPSARNLDRIEALVHDGDPDVRATSLLVMGGVDKARATRMAESALKDPDGLVRAAAVPIAAEGAGEDGMRILAELAVEDPVWQVRARALDALGGSDDPAVREVFARSLADPVRHVRRTALHAGIAHPGLLPVDQLSEVVSGDPDWENRADAARALGASQDPAAAPALESAASDPNEFVRASAARERRRLPAEAPPIPN